jgi:hypothetical protein
MVNFYVIPRFSAPGQRDATKCLTASRRLWKTQLQEIEQYRRKPGDRQELSGDRICGLSPDATNDENFPLSLPMDIASEDRTRTPYHKGA